jgi:hypothetical protein
VKGTVRIPDDLRAFLREVATRLEWDDRHAVVGSDAFRHECGRGGRIDGSDSYGFTYFTPDGFGRWTLTLTEAQIREAAAGTLDELEVEDLDGSARRSGGEALLVWGEYDQDALRVRASAELGVALDALHGCAAGTPCTLRLWSVSDDQVFAILDGPEAALYVVSSAEGYGSSLGDPARNDVLEIVDHDAGTVGVPGSDRIPWSIAKPALLHFAEHGTLGTGVVLDGRIPSQLLVFGDFDRDAELATRRAPVVDPALTSLPAKAPHGAWAERLVGGLVDLQLLELDTSIVDTVTARVSMLLAQWGDEAQESAEAAQRFAKELARLSGVARMFATAGDLQIALRRTQDPPTQPVSMPI